MANHLAIALDRRGLAEMSCIAGVGGDVPKLVRIAKSGRRIIGIDGCALACVRQCLARHGVEPSDYHILSDHGVRKRYQADFDPEEAARVLARIAGALDSAAEPPRDGAAAEPRSLTARAAPALPGQVPHTE